jgi:transposase
LDPGQRSDFRIAESIAPPAGKRVIADKGYDSDKLRAHFARGGVPIHRGRYRFQYRVENFFQRMKRFRAIATRYDKLSIHFLSAVQLVAVLDWICFRV